MATGIIEHLLLACTVQPEIAYIRSTPNSTTIRTSHAPTAVSAELRRHGAMRSATPAPCSDSNAHIARTARGAHAGHAGQKRGILHVAARTTLVAIRPRAQSALSHLLAHPTRAPACHRAPSAFHARRGGSAQCGGPTPCPTAPVHSSYSQLLMNAFSVRRKMRAPPGTFPELSLN